MEVLTAVIGKVVELALAPAWETIKRQYDYAFNYNRNVDDLRDKVQKLENVGARVQHDVDKATRQLGEEIEADVQQWLKNANAILEENSKFLDDAEEAKKKSCLGFCPNLKSRYGVGKNSQKRAEVVAKCCGEGNFPKVTYLPAPCGIGDRSPKDYEAFESRIQVLNAIMEALKDPDVDLVGVYGMPGVGKTTLVKKIAEQVKATRAFDEVVLAVVSRTPSLRKIQGEIADGLDFKLEAETERGRADRLRERLIKEKKMLVILDDIWEEIKLEDVGIPVGRDHVGCKILMTSRNRKVLSHQMGAKGTFMLSVLIENEAWNLFEKMAGHVVNKNPAFNSVAIEVAKRCGGLPILLVTVARALKDGDLSDWKDALGQLQRIDNDEMDAQVYTALELSFNHLKDEEVKSLFLFCGQLRANGVLILDLLKYAVGLGLFKRSNTLEDARIRLHKLINDLKASCLLLGDEKDGFVKMHDVVHNFAISYASRYRNMLTMSDELKEWPSNTVPEQCTGIFLVYCKVPELPAGLECPKVESIILYNCNSSLKIPDDLFRGIRKLRVVDLSDVHLSSPPSSLQFLENLQTLCLDRCGLEDVAMIGKLKMLQVLSLMGSNVVRLPTEIGELTRLQILDLSTNPTLEVIPPNVLSRLTQLEDLYLENSFVQWEVERLNTQRNNASLDELKHLSNLVTLDIHVTDAENLPKDLLFQKLERFRIFIGDVWDWSGKYETTKTLKLKLGARSFRFEHVIQALLKRTEDLYLYELKGIKSVLYELDGEGFTWLKHLHIQNSPEIQYLVDSMLMHLCVAFPVLESLSLNNLENLEKICHGQPTAESFAKLRILKVERCHRLKSLFSLSMASRLLRLEEINVNDCELMEVIFDEEQSERDTNRDEAMEFTQLRALILECLPKFTSICTPSTSQTRPKQLASNARSTEIVSDHETPMLLSNKRNVFPNLEDLKLSSIQVEKIWDDQPVDDRSRCILNLTSLTVEDCGKLKYLFTSSMVKSLTKLKRLEIRDCKLMEEIIVPQDHGEGGSHMLLLFPKLERLKVQGLPKLARFCTTDLIEYPSLGYLSIEECPKMKTFVGSKSNYTMNNVASTSADHEVEKTISSSILFDKKVAFPKLYGLQISNMNGLEMIWHNELHTDSFSKLKTLNVQHGKKLLEIFPPNMLRRLIQNLEDLAVYDCDSIKELFDLQSLMNAKGKHATTAKKENAEKGERAATATQLRSIDIRYLPNLKNVWNGNPQGILSFQNLRSAYVQNCPNLNSIFPASVALGLLQLEVLGIHSCGVEEIVSKEEGVEAVLNFVFPKLTSLQLFNLSKLERFYPGMHTLEWPALKRLRIYHCDKIPCFGDQLEIQVEQPLFSFRQIITNLEVLTLTIKDATMICPDQFPSYLFHNQKHLELICFHGGYSAADFPFGLLQRFQDLEELFVGCGNLKELFSSRVVGEEKENARPTLARIRHLRVYPGMHTSEWPALKRLRVYHCDKIPIFDSSEIQNSQGPRFGDPLEIQVEQPLFSFRQIITNLEGLPLTIKDATMICHDKFPSYLFHKLKRLELECFHDGYSAADFPFGLLQRFKNLEELFVECGHLKELFSSRLVGEEDENARATLARIRYLRVDYLPDLQHMWNQDFPVDQLLPNLETLEVWNCNSLINLAPPTASFRNLKSLDVCRCKGMTYLITSSAAKGLVQLTIMKVRDCDMVIEIIASSEGDEGENQIVFRRLESLAFDRLTGLASFCSANFNFKFPSLTEATMTACPNMKAFSHGISTTPKLQKVWVSERKDKGQWKGDLNKTIIHMHTAGEYEEDFEEYQEDYDKEEEEEDPEKVEE